MMNDITNTLHLSIIDDETFRLRCILDIATEQEPGQSTSIPPLLVGCPVVCGRTGCALNGELLDLPEVLPGDNQMPEHATPACVEFRVSHAQRPPALAPCSARPPRTMPASVNGNGEARWFRSNGGIGRGAVAQ